MSVSAGGREGRQRGSNALARAAPPNLIETLSGKGKKKLLPGAARTQSDEVDFEIMVRGVVNFVLEN